MNNYHTTDQVTDKVLDNVLDDAAALALGAFTPREAQEIFRHIQQSSAMLQEYKTMLWATHHLPAVLPLAEPPASLRKSILREITTNPHRRQEQPASSTERHHSEFIPEFDAKGAAFYSVFSSEGSWLQHPVKGISVKPLATDKDRGYATLLMRLEQGTVFPSHKHAGAEQCYVLSGAVKVMGKTMNAGDFFSTQANADHGDIFASEAAMVLLVVAMEDYRKSAWRLGAKALQDRLRQIFA